MPRGRGRSSSRSSSSRGGGFFGRKKSTSNTRNTATRSRPQPKTQARQGSGLFGGQGLMGTLMQGMAFGAGSEVAHQAIRGVMGGSGSHGTSSQQVDHAQSGSGQQQQQFETNPCMEQNNNFVECLKFNSSDIQACQDFFNQVQECNTRNGF